MPPASSRELKKILIVDDDHDILSVAQMCLQTIGKYDVSICSHSTDVFSKITELMPDLVLLDVMMPGMNGAAVAEALTQHPFYKSLLIVFMTARVQAGEADAYLKYNNCAVIPKPFNPMTLSDEVAEIWERHHNKG